MMSHEHDTDGLDRRISSLSGDLRDQGTAPGRDLWPEIDAAIGKMEQVPVRGRGRARTPALWRVASLAASLVLLLGLGYVGMTGNTPPDGNRAGRLSELNLAATAGETSMDPASLQGLDQTLKDLNDAQRRDPDNLNLSRLVVLVHKSRAEIIRHQALQWTR